MIHYCTYFDRNYLTRAMALHRSLVRHSPPFTLWALCFDDDALAALNALRLEGVRPIPLAELEAADPELLEVKGTRNAVEYYFTCSPGLPRYVMRQDPDVDLVTYLDADLLFYSSPLPVFDELGDGSVLIVPHRFPEQLRHREMYGIYNVGLVSFRNDANGRAILDRWHDQCIAWCYDRVEDGRFADQRYLDEWPGRPGVVVLENPGAGLAPWNVMRYDVQLGSKPWSVDGRPLVFYHFQGVKFLRRGLWDVGLDHYGVHDPIVRDRLYGEYIGELRASAKVVRASARGRLAGMSGLRDTPSTWGDVLARFRQGQVVVSLGISDF